MKLMASIAKLVDASQPGATDLRRVAIQLLTQWYVWGNDPVAEGAVLEIVAGLTFHEGGSLKHDLPLTQSHEG